MKFSFTFFLICLVIFINSQNPCFDWAIGGDNPNTNSAIDIVVDDSQNIYNIGTFTNTYDVNPGLGINNLISNGGNDIYIQKLTSNGDFTWGISFGGNAEEKCSSILVDSQDNIYVAGSFEGSVDFDPGISTNIISSVGGVNGYILKLDSSGSLLWVYHIGNSLVEISDIYFDNSQNLVATGNFNGNVDFNSSSLVNSINSSLHDVFMLKIDLSGNYIYAESYGGTGSDYGESVFVDKHNNIFISGRFQDSIDFNNSLDTNYIVATNQFDGFLLKIDSLGVFHWVKKIGGNLNESVKSVLIDSSESIYITGFFESSTDFDPGPGLATYSSNGGRDYFIEKLDSNGNLLWVNTIGSSSTDEPYSLALDINSNICVSGRIDGNNPIDVDPGIGQVLFDPLHNNAFIHKFSPTGDFISFYGVGWTARGYSLFIDDYNNHFLCGSFFNTSDFDNSSNSFVLNSNFTHNSFLLKLSPKIEIDTIVECISYTWIDGITYYTDNNTATYLTNNNGCEILKKLNLTLITIDTTIDNQDPLLSSNQQGGSYQWLFCDNFFSEFFGENNQTLQAPYNEAFCVEITLNGCVDTSECVTVYSSDIIEFNQKIIPYPNPTKDQITMDIKGYNGTVNVEIYDLQGRLLENTINTTISLRKYERGIYIFKVSYGEITEEVRVVRE